MRRRRLFRGVFAIGFAALGLGRRAGPAARANESHGLAPAAAAALGAVSPAAAPGHLLQLGRTERPAGWAGWLGGAAGASVACVAAGEAAAELAAGEAKVWRAGEGGDPDVEVLKPGAPALLRAGDCVAADPDGAAAACAVRNAGAGPLVLWEARLATNPLSRHRPCG
jgi:hypothetical protein